MSDLRVFDGTSKIETSRRAAEFIKRCDIILAYVFHQNYDVRQAFAAWITPLIYESENPVWLLHEHPLHVAAEYLGMDTLTIASGDPIASEYETLARKMHW